MFEHLVHKCTLLYHFHANQRSKLDIIPELRKLHPSLTTTSSAHLARLETLMQILQGPDFFSLESGSYPTSRQWTSTVLNTIVIDYSHLTGDNQYFSHIVVL